MASPSYPLPGAFIERMRRLLGGESEAFLASLAEPAPIGLRVNTLKLLPQVFQAFSPFPLTPVPWCPAGFFVSRTESSASEAHPVARSRTNLAEPPLQPGKHPYHSAGLYYLQEPSAMLVVELLDPQPGERVLDLAAAPGGKTTHIAARMDNQGSLLANEIHPQRAWVLAENMERCGVRIAAITAETPPRLADHFGGAFDRVLVDAPCSGESMFPRSEPARDAWSPALVQGCATRQVALLAAAARLVRPGGRLVYATCTFAPEENEGVLARFLTTHPEFDFIEIARAPYLSPGRPDWIGAEIPSAVQQSVRFWPHHAPGEGFFAAVLQRNRSLAAEPTRRPLRARKIPEHAAGLFRDFYAEALDSLAVEPNLALVGSYLYHLPPNLPDLNGLRVIHPGWWLGTLKKERFEPSHALALGLTAEDIRHRLDLDGMVNQYLRGESLPVDGEEGWVLLTINNYPIGWGRRVKGVIKNFYPKGLRWF